MPPLSPKIKIFGDPDSSNFQKAGAKVQQKFELTKYFCKKVQKNIFFAL